MTINVIPCNAWAGALPRPRYLEGECWRGPGDWRWLASWPPAAPRGGSKAAAPSAAADLSADSKIVNWANWTLYLDYDDKSKKYPTLERFMKETGIKATYSEDIDSNDTYYGKIQAQLAAGKDIGQDIITPSDWMSERLIRQGYVQELNHANIPNIKNLLPELESVRFDPGRKKSLTWQSGFTGLAWNKEAFPKGLKNVSDLWDPALKGRVTVLDEMRDTMPMLMLDAGHRHRRRLGRRRILELPGRAGQEHQERPDPPGQGQLLQAGLHFGGCHCRPRLLG